MELYQWYKGLWMEPGSMEDLKETGMKTLQKSLHSVVVSIYFWAQTLVAAPIFLSNYRDPSGLILFTAC